MPYLTCRKVAVSLYVSLSLKTAVMGAGKGPTPNSDSSGTSPQSLQPCRTYNPRTSDRPLSPLSPKEEWARCWPLASDSSVIAQPVGARHPSTIMDLTQACDGYCSASTHTRMRNAWDSLCRRCYPPSYGYNVERCRQHILSCYLVLEASIAPVESYPRCSD